jgi:hypothetical protein
LTGGEAGCRCWLAQQHGLLHLDCRSLGSSRGSSRDTVRNTVELWMASPELLPGTPLG